MRKRSDFEHKLNARGSHPSDYAKYAAYEMNLESLWRLRTKRMGVKTTNHSGPRRIFFVLERATRKFHGDIGLWMQYVSFARKQKVNKKVSEILTRMIRLFPTKPEIWIYAASYALEEKADMLEARNLMQRALRFCKKNEEIWIEYGRLEMIYVAKLAARSEILGLGQDEAAGRQLQDESDFVQLDHISEDFNASEMKSREEKHRPERRDHMTAKSGAIPLAIFDAAMVDLGNSTHFALTYYDMIAEFDIRTRHGILSHISSTMHTQAPDNIEVLERFVQEPVLGFEPVRVEFPMSLATSLERLEHAIETLETPQSRQLFLNHMTAWLREFLETDDLNDDIRIVLQSALRKTQRQSEKVVA